MKKEKKYQITGQILLAADGWVRAKNKEEAKKKWRDFCLLETNGLSVLDVEITEILTPNSKYYDKSNAPSDEEFDQALDKSSITFNFWN